MLGSSVASAQSPQPSLDPNHVFFNFPQLSVMRIQFFLDTMQICYQMFIKPAY